MTRFGRFLILIVTLGLGSFSVSAAQDDPAPYRPLVARFDFANNDATLSSINIKNAAVETVLTITAPQTAFSLSPQGDRVAYSALLDWSKAWDCCPGTGTTAFMLDLNSRENTRIAENAALAGNSTYQAPVPPVWSPDGSQVVVIHQIPDDPEYHEMLITGGDSVRHLIPDRFPSQPVLWSSDGTMLAYFSESFARTGIGVVFAFKIDGTDTGRILLSDDPPEGEPNYYQGIGWIPGTHDLLVHRGRFYKQDSPEVLRVNADDGSIKILLPAAKPPNRFVVDLLSDGRALSRTSDADGMHIDWLDLDTGALTPSAIPQGLLNHWSYQKYSPDATKAAVAVYDEATQFYHIAIYDLESGVELANIPVTTDYIYDFIWSPDGQQIAVGAARVGDSNTDTAIYVLNADEGGTPRRVARNVGTTLIGWQT